MTPSNRLAPDALYHRLFSHPGVVAQLLRAFADGPWLADLDLAAMERLNATFHADTGARREGDMVWRIPRRDGADTYLVLLLEFQSTSDAFMALRVLTYASLLWQQLVGADGFVPNGRLPPLLPIVVYNGESRWRAARAVRDLIALLEASPLWQWQPALRYHLIDVGAFTEADLAAREGLPALWFRLENAPDPVGVAAVADAVVAWLSAHPGYAAARAVFSDMLAALMTPLGPDIRMPEDLMEMRDMLATRAEQWRRDWLREGRQAGEAAMLLRILERRFGPLPQAVADRVRAADISLLDVWGTRVLDAATLDAVLAPAPD